MKKIATVGMTRDLMANYNFRTKKSLGQNFIIDPNIIDNIVHTADIDKEDIVIEIGPGMGSLTQGLLEAAGQVIAIEIDQNLITPLTNSLGGYENFTLVNDDALNVNFNELLAPLYATGKYREGFVVVANLPYYITTPLIMNFLEGNYPWRKLVFMVQKEVAERMQAKPSTKNYGSLTIAVQYRAAAKIAMTVPPTVFIPRPAVDSSVIVLDRLEKPPVEVESPEAERELFKVIKAGFSQRRKTLLNSLAGGLGLDKETILAALEKANIEPTRRGETLTIEEYATLTNAFTELK